MNRKYWFKNLIVSVIVFFFNPKYEILAKDPLWMHTRRKNRTSLCRSNLLLVRLYQNLAKLMVTAPFISWSRTTSFAEPEGTKCTLRKRGFRQSMLKTDCSKYPPNNLRVIPSARTINKWRAVPVDTENAFLQTYPVARKVYVIPPLSRRFVIFFGYWKQLHMV